MNRRNRINPRSSKFPRSLDLNKPSMDFDSSFNEPSLEQTITDPNTKDTYLLNFQIGSFSNGQCHVYRALFSKYSEDDGVLVPSGYVTLKILNLNIHESNLIRCQGTTAITPNSKIIGSNRSFIAANLFCVSLPYMSEGSLRSILSTRPDKKLPEEFISIVLKEVVIGLLDEIHVESNPRVHKTLNAGDIFVNIDDNTKEMSIKLAFEVSVYDSEPPNCNSSSLFLNPKSISTWGAAPEVFECENANNNLGPKSDIWLVGITALELAYGNLPVRNRIDLKYIIEKIRKHLRIEEFSRKFVDMVLLCLRENPDKRPTASQLLNTRFFISDIERFKQFVLNDNK